MNGRVKLAVCFSISLSACAGSVYAQQQVIGAPPEASNMKLVGFNDLQARSAYQPTIHHQGDRWIAYIGHHGGTDDVPDPVNPQTGNSEPNGTSIVDVTDPAQPRYLRHIPGQQGKYEAGGAQMVRICDGKDLPKGQRSAVYMLRTFGSEAHEIWNVADPANPVLVARISGLKDTHKNFWECDTGIAFLVSGAPDWRTRRMTQVYDLSDPAHPVKIRDFGLPGQEPGSTGAVPTELHGPISTGPSGNRVYFGYGTNKGGFLQIVDRMRGWSAIAIAVLALGALTGGAAYENAALRGDNWREIGWPFPRDGWPTGRAFRCASCGVAVEVYVRPKIGFCNCDRGVTDDDEVDRVADLDLLSDRFVPLEAGKVVRVADMQGRIRAYDVRMSDGSQRAAIGIAVSRRCDLLVAVAQGKADATEVKRVALKFLNARETAQWMTAAMEGR